MQNKKREDIQFGFGFYYKTEDTFSKTEINNYFVNEQRFFISHLEKIWLERYWKMKALEREVQVPSINSVISDMPSGGGNTNNSKTEFYALQSIKAGEWLEHFHSHLDALPEDYKRLIEVKYLEKRQPDGKHLPDKEVYEKLFIGKTKFTTMKKQALEELGRSLYRTFDYS